MMKPARISLALAAVVMMTFYLLSKPGDTFRSDLTPTSPTGVKPAQYPDANDLRQNNWGGSNHSAYIDEAIKKALEIQIHTGSSPRLAGRRTVPKLGFVRPHTGSRTALTNTLFPKKPT